MKMKMFGINTYLGGKEQIKKRSICRHSPNRWVGGLGNFKKKVVNNFLTLGGVKPLFYQESPTFFVEITREMAFHICFL